MAQVPIGTMTPYETQIGNSLDANFVRQAALSEDCRILLRLDICLAILEARPLKENEPQLDQGQHDREEDYKKRILAVESRERVVAKKAAAVFQREQALDAKVLVPPKFDPVEMSKKRSRSSTSDSSTEEVPKPKKKKAKKEEKPKKKRRGKYNTATKQLLAKVTELESKLADK